MAWSAERTIARAEALMFAAKGDPYHDHKKYHRAFQIRPNGDVTALCFKTPRPINLKVALWTIRDEAVTCRGCRVRMKQIRLARPTPGRAPEDAKETS